MTTKEHLSRLIGEFLSEKELASLLRAAELKKPERGLFFEKYVSIRWLLYFDYW